MIVLIFLMLFVIMIVMLLNAGGQTIAAKETMKAAITNEFQERNRISSLLEFELLKWVKEPSFISNQPFKWEDVKSGSIELGVQSSELYLLYSKPELWLDRAKEWVLRNSRGDLIAATYIIAMVRLSLNIKVLKEKLGYHEFDLMESRLNHDYKSNPFRGTGRIPFSEPDALKDWSDNLEEWSETYHDESMCLGLTFPYFDSDSRFSKRYEWVRQQVREKGSKNYSKIWKDAKENISTGNPEDPAFLKNR